MPEYSDELRELPARSIYETLRTKPEDAPWEQVPEGARQPFYKAAAIAAARSPAPIVIRCAHAAPFPSTGMEKHIYANVTSESIDAATQQFRSFLEQLADDWRHSYRHLLETDTDE